MKVVVVNPSLFTTFYDKHFCRALVERGLSVTMVGRPLREDEQYSGEPYPFRDLFYRGTGQRKVGWGAAGLGRVRKVFEHAMGLRALERFAAEQHADIVHFQWLVLPFLDRISLSRLHRQCGLVLTVHNAEFTAHDSAAAVGKFGAMIQSLDRKQAILSFDRYVVHSAKAFEALIAIGARPEAIVHRPHPPLNLDAAIVHSPLRADERRDILFFGQIKPYKGLDTLVDAGIAMAATRRDFRITIAGRPYQSVDAMRARIAAAGVEDVFHFDLDYVSDARLAQYLSAASVVVFPYREIDGSGALSHAIRFEKPIVASRVGGFTEAPFRDHIELVPPADAGALQTTLERLLNDPDRLEALRRQTGKLRNLLPSWADFASACEIAYSEIQANRRGG